MSTDIERVENGKFAPGVSANPGGRPKQLKEVVELARTHTKSSIEALVEIRDDRTAQAMARVKAAELLLGRGWGQPALETDLDNTLDGNGPVTFVFKLGEADRGPLVPPPGAADPDVAGELVGEIDEPLR